MKTDNTTAHLSRRRLLASMPAAAAAMPAAATALCRRPAEGDDPMIEAVARHRQAWEAHEAAWEHMSKTQDEFGSEETARIFLYEYDETEADPVNVDDGELHIRWKKTGKKTSVFATDYADIESAVPKHLRSPKRTADREAWIIAKKKELDEAKEAAEERAKHTPTGIALQAAHNASNALEDVTEELLSTAATTAAGVAAALEHLADISEAEAWDQAFNVFEDEPAEFIRGLAKTLHDIA